MECCEDPENPGSFYLRFVRQDLLVELVKCKDSRLVVCVVDTEFLVYRERDDALVDTSIKYEMVRDIAQVLKRNAVANGFKKRQPTSVHIFTNTNFYDSAERVARELGIRVFCHRFLSRW